ncbi:hypothetical protein ABH937_006682 [Kitasatospora sp. GAS1066B]
MSRRVDLETRMLHDLTVELGVHSERLFHISTYRSPTPQMISKALEDLTRLQKTVIINTGDGPLSGTTFTADEEVAHRRSTLAYGMAGVLISKAVLRATPALVAAVQIRDRPAERPVISRERLTSHRALSAARHILDEAAATVAEIAANLTGPEPKALLAITEKAAGEHAQATTRSAVDESVQAPHLVYTARPAAKAATTTPSRSTSSTATAPPEESALTPAAPAPARSPARAAR